MKKRTIKAIISVLLACLMLFGGTTAAFASDGLGNIGDSLKESLFVPLSDFIESNGIQGALIYPFYITVIAPLIYLMGILGFGSIAAVVQGIADNA